jgi:hypothetical protein
MTAPAGKLTFGRILIISGLFFITSGHVVSDAIAVTIHTPQARCGMNILMGCEPVFTNPAHRVTGQAALVIDLGRYVKKHPLFAIDSRGSILDCRNHGPFGIIRVGAVKNIPGPR